MERRTIAVVAHVDHGKTTLLDRLLRQAGADGAALDALPLERERGITIAAKFAAVTWRNQRLQFVDTPGHGDFGGEVERSLVLADGVLLLVDAAEGPMPQTRFVLERALARRLPVVVVLNKVDRPDGDPERVREETLELLLELAQDPEVLDMPVLFAVGRAGRAAASLADLEQATDLAPLLEVLVARVPAQAAAEDAPLRVRVVAVDEVPFVGRLALGQVLEGSARDGDAVRVLCPDGSPRGAARPARWFVYDGLQRVPAPRVVARDLVAAAVGPDVAIGDTIVLSDADVAPLPSLPVDEPTVAVDVVVNTSPLAGREGVVVSLRQLAAALRAAAARDPALRVEESDAAVRLAGRGELHLGVTLEALRRQGWEFAVGRPQVLLRRDGTGQWQEPYEEATVEVAADAVGAVTAVPGPRRGELLDLRPLPGDRVRLRYRVPARGWFGVRRELLAACRGEVVVHQRHIGYGPWAGPIPSRARGVMVSLTDGEAVAYALFQLQARGTFFVAPGEPVYAGMVVGEHVRPEDLEVNVTRTKKLTNVRAAHADDNILLEPPRRWTLEEALGFVADDEWVEVTPQRVRLRKRGRTVSERKKARRLADHGANFAEAGRGA